MKNKKLRIVILCEQGFSSRAMYNALSPHHAIECVIIENKPSVQVMLGRFNKLGILRTVGQLLFLVFNKILARASLTKNKELISKYGLDDKDFPCDIVQKVESVNSKEVIKLLKEISPDAVVVNGTRIIATNILSSIDARFLNTHMGITPKYRGVHGGYWALVNEDRANCGVTVHLIDQGIDTGGVLYQDTINTDHSDNINTYPIHQIAKGISLMKAALEDITEDEINVRPGVYPSKLWYHPTLIEYFKHWVQKGVK